jgi:transposase
MRKMKKSESARKAILGRVGITREDRLFVGVDVHKSQYHLAVWSCRHGRAIATWVAPACQVAALSRLEPLREQVARVVYEAGPTGFGFARRLAEAGWPVQVISPAHTPESPADRDKSDRLDARKLSRYCAKGLLHPVYIPTAIEEADRAVFRSRDQTIRQLRRVKQQIKSYLLCHDLEEPVGLRNWTKKSVEALGELEVCDSLRFGLDQLLASLAHFSKQLQAATARLRELSRSERYRARFEGLTMVPGVGLITAMAYLLELPNPERFATSRQVSRMLCLSPCVRSSGETTRQAGRGRGGQDRLRSLLIEAAWQWKRRDALAFDHYNRILRNTGSAKKAITAVARKLGIILWRIAIGPHVYMPGVSRIPETVFEGMKRKADRVAAA